MLLLYISVSFGIFCIWSCILHIFLCTFFACLLPAFGLLWMLCVAHWQAMVKVLAVSLFDLHVELAWIGVYEFALMHVALSQVVVHFPGLAYSWKLITQAVCHIGECCTDKCIVPLSCMIASKFTVCDERNKNKHFIRWVVYIKEW